ncbi:MAG: efflux RND transporter permease subunit [bacterium]|nr:efflux RND transporter permease subunit [bacterium]
MRLIDRSIRYPISVTVGVLLLALFGAVALMRIPVQLTPTVEKPEITVDTRWPGASPQEVEREIVEEQEEQLKSIEGLKRLTSESQDGRGSITMEFEVGSDMNSNLLKVSNRLNQVPSYPDEADEPVISSVNIRGNAIAWFILKPKPGNPININHMRDFADDFIKPRIERVSGVARSNIYGGQEREMRVIVDPEAMAARNVTLLQMATALDSENRNVSAGDFDEGKRRYIVRTTGEFQSPEDVADVIVARHNGSAVYVRDVARVELGFKDADFAVRHMGEPSIALNALRATGSNVLDTMQGLHRAVEDLNEGILADRDLSLTQVYDETDYIKSAISLVTQNLWIGGTLAILVLLLFLRSASSTFIIALAIPISVVGTFFALWFVGRNLNVVSLAGMAFAVGMVVDNSIVVLENIYRHRQLGKNRREAAYEGAVEVWGAVLASTLTTIAVFLPIIFVKEEAGQLFRDIAIAISCGVGLSLIVAITVIPSLSNKILTATDEEAGLAGPDEAPSKRYSFRTLWGLAGLLQTVTERFAGLIHWLCGRRLVSLVVIVGLTLASLGGSWLLMPDTEYLPTGNRNLVLGILLPPPGYNLEELTEMGRLIESRLAPHWSDGERPAGSPGIKNFFYVARGRQVFMGAIAADPRRARDLVPIMQRSLAGIPGMIAIVTQTSLFRRALGEGRNIDVEITGPKLEKLVGFGGRLFADIMQLMPPGTQARPIPSLDLGNPEVRIIPDRERAAELQLSSREIGFIVDSLVDGTKASDYQYEGDEIDLTLMGDDRFARRTQDLARLPIRTPTGRIVTLGSVADIRVVTGPEQVNRIERQRAITLQVIPPTTMPIEAAMRLIDEKLVRPLRAQGALGRLYNIQLAGTADKLTQTRKSLQWNFLLAIIITYLLMASLFESFLYPFVIMFSVPLASLGGFLGLLLVNATVGYQALDILTMLGFVILIGIVVNNAILIVHQALNHMRDEGMEAREAVRESVRNRVRPIFMSTTTSVFGMAPLILFPGAGSELYRGLGSVVVGGLVLSTLFTLVLVPILFYLTLSAREAIVTRLRALRGRSPA